MTPLLKSLLGNGSKDRELAEEMRAILHEMQQERGRHEALIQSVRDSADRLQQLGEPIAKAGSDVDAVVARLGDLELRFAAMEQLATQFQTLDERAAGLAQDQQLAESRIAETLQDSQRVRSVMENLGLRVDLALDLKDQLAAFLEVEKPFQQLRGEADTLRGQVDGTGEHLVRLRDQHDRLLDAHKLATSKMEALDRRRDDLGRSLQDKERRVASVEHAVREMDGVQHTVEDVRREMGTLKAMADLVAQKTAGLEAQRETVDRALAQAEHLDRAMRQIDAGVRQQQENEKTLGTLQEQIAAVRSLHETVVERSSAISQLQREIDERTQATRQDLAAVTDETKKTVERFDFERRGMESVTQRVADLRAAVSDCESRFKGLSESGRAVGELKSQTQAIAAHLQILSAEVGQVDEEMAKLQAIRRDLDDTGRTAREVGVQVAQIEEARPAVEAALRDLEQLSGAHAMVKDSLEQTQLTHGEIARVRESQSETRSWLAGVEQSVGELRDQVGELHKMAPMIAFVEKQTQRIGESMAAIESRREFVEDLNRRMADVEALSGQLDERGRQLQTRMEAAEQRFVGLAAHAEEAERMTMTVAAVSSGLNEAGREADEIRKTVAAIVARSESVEELAERTRALGQELKQRHHALAESTKDLKRASALRQEAAASAQQLDELTRQLTSALSTADQRVMRVDELSTQLENRVTNLRAVEKRLGQFEERLATWDLVDQEIARSLEQISARQGTVEALQADLDRMFVMAEKTATHVREITSAHQEIEESREHLKDVMGRLRELRDTASALDERKRQMAKAEERLARADGLLADVQSSLEALQGQKAIVDQAVEKAGSLQFLLKQAEAAIEGLREEREMTARVRVAMAVVRQGEDEDDGAEEAQAA
jgi:chromosome segregation ATPase